MAAPMPEGWQEVMDPSSGKPYYFNPATQETTWDRPGGAAPQMQMQMGGGGGGALPAGWQEHFDAGSGKSYFHNQSTGETKWDRPTEGGGCGGCGGCGFMPPAAMPDAGGALPPGWEAHADPSTGNQYYYNAATQQTTWERPTAGAGGACYGGYDGGMGGYDGGCGAAGCGGAGCGGPSPGMKMGTVKVWFEEKGFGFIAQDSGEDVFCHRNSIENAQSLDKGAQVEFSAEWSNQRSKYQVQKCRVVSGAPAGQTTPAPGGATVAGNESGTVKVWFEEKGFGFIAPSNGGTDVFVHRNALADGWNLQTNASVTYSAEWNPQKGKYTASSLTGAVPGPNGETGKGKGKGDGKGKGGGGGDRFQPYGGGSQGYGGGDSGYQQDYQGGGGGF